MSESQVTIYTVGHSRHSIDRFLELTKNAGIDRIVDVRGQPYSRYNPHFNRETLSTALGEHGLVYDWRGLNLSGRPRSREFYGADGKVLWGTLSAWPAMHEELRDVAKVAAMTPTALMCAEENPRQCHRRFLLTPPLVAMGLDVEHIRGNGARQRDADLPDGAEAVNGQLNLFG